MKAAIALLLLAIALPAAGIIRRHDRDDARYLALGRPWKSVVDLKLPGGAGTLVRPSWVVTAAHAAALIKLPHSIAVDGKEFAVKAVHSFPGGGEGKDDIALLQLEIAVRGVTPVPLYTWTDESAGASVVFAGRGLPGDGRTGPAVRDGLLRAATNQIDAVKKNWLVFGFEEPPAGTELEGISGPGDSGGPAFLVREGTVFLAGVSSGQDHRATGKEGVYGVTEYYVRISSYAAWVEETIARNE